ncbi:hypothetical protein N752_21290 [Desulforamulus aquiferis]|nr:hypothetical protein [Desulforamulus aquiferis]RYD03133.1 hypothetical protein N752_21290 [Desulforamulus aquiferis]
MEIIESARPGLAVLVSLLAVILIGVSGRYLTLGKDGPYWPP